MARIRAIIEVPAALASELDTIAGPGHRSEFAVEILQRELKRRRLLALLSSSKPMWNDADNPELGDAAAWIHNLRQESDHRLKHLDQDAD